VFGLAHCVYFSCAMNESTTIQEAINQPLFMCPICLKKIQAAIGFDISERYQKLKNLLEMVHSGLLEMENIGSTLSNSEQSLSSELLEKKQKCTSDLLELGENCSKFLEVQLKSSNLLKIRKEKHGLLEMVPMASGDFLDIMGEGKSSESGSRGRTVSEDTILVKDSMEKFVNAIQWLESVLMLLDNDGVD